MTQREYVEVTTSLIVQELNDNPILEELTPGVVVEELVTETLVIEELIEGPPGPQGPPGAGGGGFTLWEPEAAEALSGGQVVACDSNGKAILASASTPARDAFGVVTAAVSIGGGAQVQTGGTLTLANWTPATGTVSLVVGAEYWLSTTNGRMQTSPPLGSGVGLTKIGRALSAQTLAIEVEKYGRRAV